MPDSHPHDPRHLPDPHEPHHPHDRRRPSRRALLGAATAATAGFAAAALPASLHLPSATAAAAPLAPTWALRWAPAAASVGLGAFETIEDDRADSHPGGRPHIRPAGDTFRFDMHLVDRDTSTDRQRQEVTGMRTSSGSFLRWLPGETWRVTYQMYIPSSLRATTTFTHIMQTKQPGTGTSPITVMSLRRVNGAQTIELKLFEPDLLVGRTDLVPLHDSWVDVDFRMRIGDGTAGSVRWILRKDGVTLVDGTRTGVDTFLLDRVRPKWGIYRSLGDTSGSLRDCHLLLRNLRGYQLVDAAAARVRPAG
ncbi:Tat pathway signal sequence domain protein [Streptomyces sp. enrichment culture]|uniref:Tat pathway signal sequence domain protein n=1 Tax=Streptomyces sp. enrichment culture TaxID=1795815 RepID=UPI003F574D9B